MSDLQQWRKKGWIELDYPMPSQSVKTKAEVANQMSLLGLKYLANKTLAANISTLKNHAVTIHRVNQLINSLDNQSIEYLYCSLKLSKKGQNVRSLAMKACTIGAEGPIAFILKTLESKESSHRSSDDFQGIPLENPGTNLCYVNSIVNALFSLNCVRDKLEKDFVKTAKWQKCN